MPFWWGRKPAKNKQRQHPQGGYPDTSESSINNDSKKRANDKRNTGSDDVVFVSTISPLKNSGSSGSGSDGSLAFSGFDSGRTQPIPLQRPSGMGHRGGYGYGYGSGSVSSVSSSGSSDDRTPPDLGHSRTLSAKGLGETKLNPMSRSPGPWSRGTATAISPLHLRFSGTSLESPTRKQEEGRRQYHPLPLPPGSPTSPPTLPNIRTCTVTDNMHFNVSKWKRGRLLGRGTFGHVFLGFNSESGQLSAIKEVRVIADDPTLKECLKHLNQEIILLSQLSHPNIVQYYGSELGADKLSVYLEYVSGGSIHKLLQEYGAFREPVIQNYTRQILYGLAYLHGRNTVHRDIKGANILVDSNGEIKLADFGMAKHTTHCSPIRSFKGSPYWMAPEVVMNTNGYSLPVDIWSLGCTIIEMATSKPPWSQFEGVAAIFKIGNSRESPAIPDHLSHDAKSFLNLCLQRDPLARPTALQLLDHPFVRDQVTTRVANADLTKEAFPYNRDGSCKPQTALELHSSGRNTYFCNGGHVTTIALMSPSARMTASSPVSPCSSPFRQSGPAYKRSSLSPPQPPLALVGQNGLNLIEYCPGFRTRSMPQCGSEPWRENFQFTSQTPYGSPRITRF
ncbi:mitogen-activated protein kinase kinase kinase 3-like isoform X3 [Rhododendron vialii]|uniref:mitogen-activated protein kinase kinase kinase 3-like isoform X3 n=1 Tax=Rhododendron vialii TaxID=182163 RepID=UPI00265E53FC|nr:mitogen-activated protein kinase kinase kinase 3-like isoform X3 [Rhododendron vialii]